MNKETTINILGREVRMLYCLAAETGYEQLNGKSSAVFVPQIEKDDKDNIISIHQQATIDDYVKLAIGCIIAAYTRKGEEVPITAEEIMYDCSPAEAKLLITTVNELRAAWYFVPEVAKSNEQPTDEKPDAEQKNA